MKSFSGPPSLGVGEQRLAFPSGNKLPGAPVPGEVYHLDVDTPPGNPLLPWYPRGTYVFNGQNWDRMNYLRQQKTGVIGARTVEFEKACSPKITPNSNTGELISMLSITPSNRRSSFSGHASFWMDSSKNCHVWAAVFRGNTLAGISAEYLEAGRPRTMAISFFDLPASYEQLNFSIRIYADAVCELQINKCQLFHFDGASQTAFIVAENT